MPCPKRASHPLCKTRFKLLNGSEGFTFLMVCSNTVTEDSVGYVKRKLKLQHRASSLSLTFGGILSVTTPKLYILVETVQCPIVITIIKQ